MATTRKRSSAFAAVSKSAIEQAGTMLKELPVKPKDNWSLREAVSLLQDSILAALDRGYSYEEVAAMLGEQGVDIATPSLKRYLASVKREKEQAPKTRRGKRAAAEPAAVAPAASAKADVEPEIKTSRKPRTAAAKLSVAKAESKTVAKKATAKPTATAKTSTRSTGTRSRK